MVSLTTAIFRGCWRRQVQRSRWWSSFGTQRPEALVINRKWRHRARWLIVVTVYCDFRLRWRRRARLLTATQTAETAEEDRAVTKPQPTRLRLTTLYVWRQQLLGASICRRRDLLLQVNNVKTRRRSFECISPPSEVYTDRQTDTDTHTDKSNLIISFNSFRSIGGDFYCSISFVFLPVYANNLTICLQLIWLLCAQYIVSHMLTPVKEVSSKPKEAPKNRRVFYYLAFICSLLFWTRCDKQTF